MIKTGIKSGLVAASQHFYTPPLINDGQKQEVGGDVSLVKGDIFHFME